MKVKMGQRYKSLPVTDTGDILRFIWNGNEYFAGINGTQIKEADINIWFEDDNDEYDNARLSCCLDKSGLRLLASFFNSVADQL